MCQFCTENILGVNDFWHVCCQFIHVSRTRNSTIILCYNCYNCFNCFNLKDISLSNMLHLLYLLYWNFNSLTIIIIMIMFCIIQIMKVRTIAHWTSFIVDYMIMCKFVFKKKCRNLIVMIIWQIPSSIMYQFYLTLSTLSGLFHPLYWLS